jgi:L,D-transpeptidase YcbB
MNKIVVLLFFFAVLSCKNEVKKKEIVPIPVSIPIIHPEGRAVQIDSSILNSFGSKMLHDFYMASGYKSVWQSKKDRKIILEQLINSEEEGLNPSDYKISKLLKYEKKAPNLNDEELAQFDVLLTHSLQKYILHLTNGRLNPRTLYPDWDLKDNKIDINTTLASLLISDSLEINLNNLKPHHDVYLKLKKALKIINAFPKDAYTKIEITNKIIENDTNPSIVEIKKRLIYWKDMKPKDSLSSIYDEATVQAIKKFQYRHGLAADGVIGKGTVESLNFSKNQRKEQIIANLERWKWFPKEMGDEYLIVNIPEYRLTVVKGKDSVRTHKVIVGRAERKTPILSSKLSTVVFNPTWTVPPTIMKEDVIPAIQKNRNYLANTNIKIYDSNGNEVSANNWKLANAKGYRYVQTPGKSNSLGMVKLIFPNRFSVYLHDTNHRDFFVKNMRSLSSGCVRVENPLDLTQYVLDDSTNWNLEKITETLQSEKTKYVKINKDVFIHILYWTAWSEKNTLIFRDDIYNLDADLYKKLRN